MKVEVSLPICGIVFWALFILKVCKIITISWWWITAPLWLPIVIILIIAFIVGLYNVLK